MRRYFIFSENCAAILGWNGIKSNTKKEMRRFFGGNDKRICFKGDSIIFPFVLGARVSKGKVNKVDYCRTAG